MSRLLFLGSDPVEMSVNSYTFFKWGIAPERMAVETQVDGVIHHLFTTRNWPVYILVKKDYRDLVILLRCIEKLNHWKRSRTVLGLIGKELPDADEELSIRRIEVPYFYLGTPLDPMKSSLL
jgi:hypothetical protein